jgi:general secretion pathway protein K
MRRTGSQAADAGDRGFIVVAVLWILSALATLAVIYAFYVTNAAMALGVHDERLQAQALTSAGIELAAYRLTADPAVQPSQGRFGFRAAKANGTVEFRSEAARIDLNVAPKSLLAGLFASLGARPELAESYADRIIAWRTAAVPGATDDETSTYRAAGLPYGPRLGPFPHAGELSLVLGLPETLVERALPFLTVHSGQAQVHLFDAAPEVIAALPGLSPERLREVLVRREREPQNVRELLAALGPAQAFVTSTATKAVRVSVRIDFDNGRRMRSEAVILLSDSGNEPYYLLSRRELDDLPEEFPSRRGAR